MLENSVIIKGRIRNKHDTEENWNKATNFAPLLGETIVYDPDSKHPYASCKVGIWDGESSKTADMLIMNLPFANQPDVIESDDIENLFSTPSAEVYTEFKMHFINYTDNSLECQPLYYVVGKTTWMDLIENYPLYFACSTTDWDKLTGKPYVCFNSQYYGGDYVMKQVTPVNPEDPVTAPCIVTDIVNLTALRASYLCSGSGCEICAEHGITHKEPPFSI
jgi:hypothetical protein